jgi:hypothetical protein
LRGQRLDQFAVQKSDHDREAMKNAEHRTLNIELPMSRRGPTGWMLDVGCWMLDVRSFILTQTRFGGVSE